jgi:uncharacterized membrane protein
MKTKETMTICLVKYTLFTRIRTSLTVIHKIGRAIGPKAHKLSVLTLLILIFAGCGALSMLSGRSEREYCKKKMLENDVRSRNVYENKGAPEPLYRRDAEAQRNENKGPFLCASASLR